MDPLSTSAISTSPAASANGTPVPVPSASPPHHTPPGFRLGMAHLLTNPRATGALSIPAHHFVTHGVVVGMTGSGKTGFVTVIAEEALRAKVPIIVLDVKGDLPNLLLAFPSFDASAFVPFADSIRTPGDDRSAEDLAAALALERQTGLLASGIDAADLAAYHDAIAVRVITPGATLGEPLHLLSSLERRSPRWDVDPEAARMELMASVSLLLRLVGIESEPAKSREHVLLSAFAERRLVAHEPADLGRLIEDLEAPPVERIGAMSVDDYLSKHARRELAASLNSLLASPALASWRTGTTLDVAEWVRPVDGRTPAVIVSVAHLDDAERTVVLGVVLEAIHAWVRAQPGSKSLRAMVLFDEVYGFLPPHPANPPTKRPIVALMKQARAFGVGVVLATQNPMDLDYRALSNAGVWCIGRLQTDADRARVVEGMTGATARGKGEAAALAETIKQQPPRVFVVRDASDGGALFSLRPRQTMSFMRGPMTRAELKAARGG